MLNISKVNPDTALDVCKELWHMRDCGGIAMMHGSVGVGKSSVGRALARHVGGKFIDIRLGQIMAEDLRGLPFQDLVSRTSGFLPPAFLPREGPAVIMFDEITCCDQRVQNAALELLLDRRIGDYVVPDDVMIIAAGNDVSHGALTFELSTAVADRLVHMEVVADAEQWLDYAGRSNLHPTVQTFIKIRPDCLDGNEQRVKEGHVAGPSPRGWEKVSNALYRIKSKRISDIVVAGIVGTSVTTDFRQIMDEIASFAPATTIMAAKDGERTKMMPKTVAGLYALVYGCRACIQDLSSWRLAMRVMNDILELEIDDASVPLGEIHRLGVEITLEKGIAVGLMKEIVKTPEYQDFKAAA